MSDYRQCILTSVVCYYRVYYVISSVDVCYIVQLLSVFLGPVWARGCCRISPPRFLAECCKRQLNQGSFVLLYFRLYTVSDLY